ncbi:LAME_0H10770g1_1 [Lachancea meyersii CBS 8951]|uniref:LAME_0H10770g1_1 n=1 Tax=Lachancea meyersii CBS 8951 TaxID=1266667 RepID=A0A1G4KGI0_9SACH|nr:LAME_0H10770g1_1 [Lachancea meyersii CBS 8951]
MSSKNTRKRFKMDDLVDQTQPLRSKPINVVFKTGLKSPVRQKRRKLDTPYPSVFDHQHVGIKLADENWRAGTSVALPEAPQDVGLRPDSVPAVSESEATQRARRLKIKNPLQTGDLPRPFLDADRSIQLEDFDQPPDSTSTPILGSPRPNSLELPYHRRLDNHDYYNVNCNYNYNEPWVVDAHWAANCSKQYQEPYDFGVSPAWHPGHVYGIPLAPGHNLPPQGHNLPHAAVISTSRNPDKSGIFKTQHSPLRHRGAEFFPQAYAGGPTVETYPWYTLGQTYREPKSDLGSERREIRDTSQQSYRSSGGEATRSS